MPVKQRIRPKETALNAIQHLKESASYEDMMYELYVLQKIERGRAEARLGHSVGHEEAKQQLSRWLS